MNKEQYVKRCVEPLLRHAGLDVVRLDYRVVRPERERGRGLAFHVDEFVDVGFAGGFTKPVRVNGDSLTRMVMDVLKAVGACI